MPPARSIVSHATTADRSQPRHPRGVSTGSSCTQVEVEVVGVGTEADDIGVSGPARGGTARPAAGPAAAAAPGAAARGPVESPAGTARAALVAVAVATAIATRTTLEKDCPTKTPRAATRR